MLYVSIVNFEHVNAGWVGKLIAYQNNFHSFEMSLGFSVRSEKWFKFFNGKVNLFRREMRFSAEIKVKKN